MSLNITKTGILKESQLNEYHVEPDGSIWEHVFHHERLDINSFNQSTDVANFPTGVYKSPQMWFNFNVCNLLSGQWEILWMQNKTITDKTKMVRWVQNVNPLTCTTWADVSVSNITKNTDSRYTPYTWGGLYRKNDGNTYLCANNGTNGNWWGACGKYNIYQGGTPAWFGEIVTTGQIDIYIRVDSIVKNAKIYKAGNLTVENNFYEY